MKTLLKITSCALAIGLLASCSAGYGCYYGSTDSVDKHEVKTSVAKDEATETRACATI